MRPFHIFIYCLFHYMLWIASCQELVVRQSPESITRPLGKTAKFMCEVNGISVINQGLHWYLQDRGNTIKWLLFYKPTQSDIPEENRNRMSLGIDGDKLCTLSITSIRVDDDGNYFCAAWHTKDTSLKIFGTGTKLSVINSEIKGPTATILSSSNAVIEETGEAIYLCHLEGFFPSVIKIGWYVHGSNDLLESEQGEIKYNNQTLLYYTSNWITVKKTALHKKYYCKYKHEGIQNAKQEDQMEIAERTYIQEKPITPEKECENSTSAILIPSAYQAASLMYTLLLVKSSLYSLLLMFFMYRSRLGICLSKRKDME